jgi:hypothetical protein
VTRRFVVSDGRTVVALAAAAEGGYVVTSPVDPELITRAETLDEAFEDVRDAGRALRRSRAKVRRSAGSATDGRGRKGSRS